MSIPHCAPPKEAASTYINVADAAYAAGQVVECEVTKRQEGKQKASLRIVGCKLSDSGGLHPNTKARFAEIPAVGQTIRMKIVNAGAGNYQFDFLDSE